MQKIYHNIKNSDVRVSSDKHSDPDPRCTIKNNNSHMRVSSAEDSDPESRCTTNKNNSDMRVSSAEHSVPEPRCSTYKNNSDMRVSSAQHSDPKPRCIDVGTQSEIEAIGIPLHEIRIILGREDQEEVCNSSDRELYTQETSFIETRSGRRYDKF